MENLLGALRALFDLAKLWHWLRGRRVVIDTARPKRLRRERHWRSPWSHGKEIVEIEYFGPARRPPPASE